MYVVAETDAEAVTGGGVTVGEAVFCVIAQVNVMASLGTGVVTGPVNVKSKLYGVVALPHL
jgi:hypothetical protein